MASISFKVEGLQDAIKGMEKEVDALMMKADRKFKVAGARMEAYGKAGATSVKAVDTGFHRRSIKHDPKAPFLTAVLTAAADYASVLEFGIFGLVHVPAHTRKITQVFGREIPEKTIHVSAHMKPMSRPARPHIVPGAERALGQLIDDLNAL